MEFRDRKPTGAKWIVVLLAMGVTQSALAVAPNPLQNAYWRFEEGPVFTLVDHTINDPVKDSINGNHLEAFNSGAAPLYTNDVPPTPLASGASNTLALDFLPNNDLYSQFNDTDPPPAGSGATAKMINNGIIEPGGGFTIEAAFKPRSIGVPEQFQTIIGKEGQPANEALGGAFEENLPTLALKIRDSGQLQIEQWDEARNLVDITTESSLNADQWYYVAVVNTGETLSLYLDSNDGSGYQLHGSTAVDGALYQGFDPDAEEPYKPDWSYSWTIGRGQFGGGPADWFDGIIDEVRLSNTALSPWEFLFAPPVEALVGDYNNDGTVDAADYTVWRDNLGGSGLPNDPTPDLVDASDYEAWKSAFGAQREGLAIGAAVPEPSSLLLVCLALASLSAWRRTR